MQKKSEQSDTGWRDGPIGPKFTGGLYKKSLNIGPAWKWRSAVATDGEKEYILLCRVNEQKDNWKAWLILSTESGASVVSRFEDHGNHPGIHIHAHCERSGIEDGPTSIGGLIRIPAAASRQRSTRRRATTPEIFWRLAADHFRITFVQGTLF
ncbi:hypothetical protein [Martelella mediterranea]|nr:hypothetical protein [Martelella mediterranea]